ncbi:MAG: hypothetical protein IIC24_07530, partial [Chloroflexi bacterium]|nr:hypothetical protein [Chloroflexota bacterium]
VPLCDQGVKAERRQAEIVAEIEGHEFYEPTRMTLATWLRQWLDEHAAPTVRPNTLRRYRGIMEDHVIPAIGGIKLVDLRPQHIQEKAPRSRGRRLDLTGWTFGQPGPMNWSNGWAGDLISSIRESSKASTECSTPSGCRHASPGFRITDSPSIVPLILPLIT